MMLLPHRHPFNFILAPFAVGEQNKNRLATKQKKKEHNIIQNKQRVLMMISSHFR